MTFNLKFALTFVSIADNGSFTRAAKQLGVAQPWVSEQIRRLEEELGFAVLLRSSRSVQLTAKGAEFLEVAREIVEAYQQLERDARRAQLGMTSRLRVGVAFSAVEHPLRKALLEKFAATYTQTALEVTVGIAEELIDNLHRSALDAAIGLLHRGADVPDLACAELGDSELVGFDLTGARANSLAALSGRMVAVPPPGFDARLHATLAGLLHQNGVASVEAPEGDLGPLLAFARARGLPALGWSPGSARLASDAVAIVPAVRARLCVLHAGRLASRPVQRLWKLTSAIADAPALALSVTVSS